MSKVAKDGDQVKVHYTGRLPDGQVFDSSEGRDPLAFTAGGQEVIPGVSQAVVGMEEGQKKTVQIPADKAYGQHDDRLVQKVPRGSLPDEAKVGDQLKAVSNGREFPVWVREIAEEEATVDANHPLAGRDLEFDLELVAVEG